MFFEEGVRNISNLLTIGTKIDAMSDGLTEFARQKGYWDPDEGPFDFALAFSTCPPGESKSPSWLSWIFVVGSFDNNNNNIFGYYTI